MLFQRVELRAVAAVPLDFEPGPEVTIGEEPQGDGADQLEVRQDTDFAIDRHPDDLQPEPQRTRPADPSGFQPRGPSTPGDQLESEGDGWLAGGPIDGGWRLQFLGDIDDNLRR